MGIHIIIIDYLIHQQSFNLKCHLLNFCFNVLMIIMIGILTFTLFLNLLLWIMLNVNTSISIMLLFYMNLSIPMFKYNQLKVIEFKSNFECFLHTPIHNFTSFNQILF